MLGVDQVIPGGSNFPGRFLWVTKRPTSAPDRKVRKVEQLEISITVNIIYNLLETLFFWGWL